LKSSIDSGNEIAEAYFDLFEQVLPVIHDYLIVLKTSRKPDVILRMLVEMARICYMVGSKNYAKSLIRFVGRLVALRTHMPEQFLEQMGRFDELIGLFIEDYHRLMSAVFLNYNSEITVSVLNKKNRVIKASRDASAFAQSYTDAKRRQAFYIENVTEPKYRDTIIAISRIIVKIVNNLHDEETKMPDDSFHLRREFNDTVVASLLPKPRSSRTGAKLAANVAGDTLLFTIGPYSPQPVGFRQAWFTLKDQPIATLHTVLVAVRERVLTWSGVPKIDRATVALAREQLPSVNVLKAMRRKALCDLIRPLLRAYQAVATKFPVPPVQVLTDSRLQLTATLSLFVEKSPDLRPEMKDCLNYRILHTLSGRKPWTAESWTEALVTFDLNNSWEKPAPVLRTREQESSRIVSGDRVTFSTLHSQYLNDCAEEYRADKSRRDEIAQAIFMDESFKGYSLTTGQVRHILRTRISRLEAKASGDPTSVQKIVDGECEEEERDEEEMIETGGPDGGGTDTVVAMDTE
jgi:hypothetical protein